MRENIMNHSNVSISPDVGLGQNILPAELTLFSIGLVVNTTVLLILLTDREMQGNVFMVYLTNLTVANLYHIVIGVPVKLVLFFGTVQRHTNFFCLLTIYSRFTSDALMMQCHVLISTNRIWAVLFPIRYRQWHNRKIARYICALPWFYVNLFVLPGLIVDGHLYRNEKDNIPCTVHTQNKHQAFWILVMMLLFYISPIFIILTAYPVIWFGRKYKSRRIEIHSVQSEPEKVTENDQQKNEAPTMLHRLPGSRSFLVLSLLTVCVFVCWTPQVVSYGMILFYHERDARLSAVADTLFSLQPVLDPFLFAMALRTFQNKLKLCGSVLVQKFRFP